MSVNSEDAATSLVEDVFDGDYEAAVATIQRLSGQEQSGRSAAARILVIERDSEAFIELAEALAFPTTYKVSLDVRRDGIAIKINEQMWTPTLRVTAP